MVYYRGGILYGWYTIGVVYYRGGIRWGGVLQEWYTIGVVYYCGGTHLKLLDRAVSGAQFLTLGVFECDIALRRSVVVLCMLYKIRCNPTHPLNDALTSPYVPVRVTRGALVAHRYTYEPPSCRTSQYRMRLFPSQCPSGTILLTPYSMVWDWRVSRARPMLFIGLSCSIPTMVFYYFTLSLLSVYRWVLWGWGFRGLGVYHSPSALHCRPLLIIIIK